MKSDKPTSSRRLFQVVIWGAEPEAVAVRAVYYATDCKQAKMLAIQEHGECCTFSIWNEEDTEQLRSKRNAELKS